jgi:hypothetical protein
MIPARRPRGCVTTGSCARSWLVPSPTPPALRDALRAIGRQVFLRIAAARLPSAS